MYRVFFYSCFVCLWQIVLFAQPVVPDFRVNGEHTPSLTAKRSSSMFINDSLGGIITWRDWRLGDEATFAQAFNNTGVKRGPNFRIQGDCDVAFKSADKFLSISTLTTDDVWFDNSWQYFHAGISAQYTTTINTNSLYQCMIPYCGTGWLGIGHTLFRRGSSYYSFLSSGGRLAYKIIDSSGTFGEAVVTGIISATSPHGAALPDGSFAVSWFNAQWPDTASLACTFFNASGAITDSVVTMSRPYRNSAPMWDAGWSLNRLLALPDTSYLLLWIEPDSLYLCFRRLSRNGAFLGQQQTIALKTLAGVSATFSIRNMAITNSKDGIFDVFISLWGKQPGRNERPFNFVFGFYANGAYTGTVRTDTTLNFNSGRHLFKTGQYRYVFHTTSDEHVYRLRIDNFTVIESEKLDDDTSGSNERAPLLFLKNSAEAAVVWNNEIETRGKIIPVTGGAGTEEKVLSSRSLQFFPDGSAVGWWRTGGSAPYTGGFIRYDGQLNVLGSDTLKSNGAPVQMPNYNSTFRILDDSTFVLLYPTTDGTRLALFDKTGREKLTVIVSPGSGTDGCGIYPDGNGKLLVHVNGMTYTYDYALNNTGPTYNARIQYYIGNGRHLRMEPSSSYPPSESANIYTLQGDTVKRNAFTTNYRDKTYKIIPLREGGFLYIIKNYDYWQVRALNNSGVPTNVWRVIHLLTPGTKTEITCAEVGDKLMFAWADTRAGSYDIWVNAWKTKTITVGVENETGAVPESFALYQNYPNPFNPVTKIKYGVGRREYGDRKEALVVLKVHDILGREIATLVNEEQGPGTHEVLFDASGLTSGVYFYTLTSGDVTLTKKLVLLK